MKKLIAKFLLFSMIITSTSSLSINKSYAQSVPTSTGVEQKLDSNSLRVVDQYERPIKKDITFTLSSFDGWKRTEIGEYTAKNGVLSGINFENGKTYSLEVKGNEYEDIEDEGFLLIKTDDGFTNFNDENINNTISVINKYTQELEIKSEGKEITEELEFDVTIGSKTEKIKSEKSKLYFDIKDNELATIKLNNDKYQMDDIKLTLKKDKSNSFGLSALFNEKDEKVTTLSIKQKQTQSENPTVELVEKEIPVKIGNNFAPSNINFELITDNSTSKLTTDNNGSLSLKLDPKKSYTLKLTDEKYEMKDVPFTLKKETNFMGLEVYNLYSNDKKLETVNITTKKTNPQPENPTTELEEKAVFVKVGDKPAPAGIKFELITEGTNTKIATDNNGSLNLKLDPKKSYTLKLVDEKYEMKDVSFTLKKETNFMGLEVYNLYSDNKKLETVNITTKKATPQPENPTVELEEKAVLVTADNNPAPAGIKFELIVDGTNTKLATDNNGSLNLKLDPKKSYTLKLVDEKYEMKDISFILKKETNFMGQKVYNLYSNDKKLETVNITTKKATPQPEKPGNEPGERPCPSQECHFSNNKVNTKSLQIYNINGKKISEDVHFKLFNGTKQEYFGYVTAKNGVFPSLSLYENDTYIIYCTDQKYTISDKPYELEVNQLYIKPNGEGKVPVRNRTSKKYEDTVSSNIEKINVRELKSGEQNKEKTHFEIPVYYGSAPYPGAGNVILTSQFEELKVPVKNGKISVDLLEDIQYAVSFEDKFNEFGIENFPMTVKDKSERTGKDPLATGRGKYVYDHSTCRSVPILKLIDIKKINNNNSKVICSKGNTIVTGMNFKDLLLATGHIKKETVEEFKNKDVDIFEIHLINPRRCEVSKVAKGNFNILKLIHNGKTVKKAYLTKNGKIIKEVPFEQDKEDIKKVNVKVDSMSIYDLAFEYEKNESSDTSTPTPEQPGTTPGEEKPEKPGKEDPTKPEKPGKEDLTKPEKPGKEDPTKPEKPGKEDPAKPEKPGKEDPAKPEKPGKEDPTKPEKPGKEDPTKPEQPGKEDPAKPEKPGKEDPTKPEQPGKEDPTKPEQPGKVDPANPGTTTPSVPGTTTPAQPAQTTKETTKETTRVAGADRINTAVEVSKKYYKSAETVIIANYEKFADSLSASALSKALKAPILLVKKDQLDSVVAQEIKRLGAKNVVVIGGEQSVDKAKNSLSKYNVQTIAGSDRYETSAKIAQEIIKRTGTTQAVIASGETFADALTVAPLANKN
ncbi:MAG: cell wall-binding repeat-containing protein, partial [Finegoldia magna]|nr:cell wall-binding repeat-containing protein [Finegoldia magna]